MKRTVIALDIPADILGAVMALVAIAEGNGERRARARVIREVMRTGLTARTEIARIRAALSRCRAEARRGAYQAVVAIVDSELNDG